jgi:hypothetical protein
MNSAGPYLAHGLARPTWPKWPNQPKAEGSLAGWPTQRQAAPGLVAQPRGKTGEVPHGGCRQRWPKSSEPEALGGGENGHGGHRSRGGPF